MHEYQKVLACLDASEFDELIAQYIATIAKSLNIKQLYFLHVTRSLELPEEILKKYPNLVAPIDESIKKTISYSIQKYFDQEIPHSFDILEGNITEQILKWSKIKDVDLLVTGIKSGFKSSDIMPRKIAKLANCSLFFIPKEFRPIVTIVVPVDFSASCAVALQSAIDMASTLKARIICQHVYQVPSGYHTTGKSFHEFDHIMSQNAKDEYEIFMEQIDTRNVEVNAEFTLDDNRFPADKIYEFAKAVNADLIFMGSRGRTKAASFILGSIAEKVLSYNKTIPMIIHKEKNEHMDIIDAIMNI